MNHLRCYFAGKIRYLLLNLMKTSTTRYVMSELTLRKWPKNFVVRKPHDIFLRYDYLNWATWKNGNVFENKTESKHSVSKMVKSCKSRKGKQRSVLLELIYYRLFFIRCRNSTDPIIFFLRNYHNY